MCKRNSPDKKETSNRCVRNSPDKRKGKKIKAKKKKRKKSKKKKSMGCVRETPQIKTKPARDV